LNAQSEGRKRRRRVNVGRVLVINELLIQMRRRRRRRRRRCDVYRVIVVNNLLIQTRGGGGGGESTLGECLLSMTPLSGTRAGRP
jgi:hypothetical protein